MKRKKVLIDLYSLENPHCGFGQIAINYAKLFAEVQRFGKEDFDIEFLLPNSYRKQLAHLINLEGITCHYEDSFWHHLVHCIPNRMPNVDLWHSINQFCRRYPQDSDTRLLFTIHDYNFLFEDDAKQQASFLTMMQQRIDRASAVTFISHYTEQLVKEHSRLNGKLTRTIYNGVENLVGRPMRKPAFVSDEKPFFFAILDKARAEALLRYH